MKLFSSRSSLCVALFLLLSMVFAQDPAEPTTIPYLSSWKWVLYIGIIVAFIDGFGIGANDVANSFANSVASGSLTLRQAVLIGLFTESGGAILLGKNTSETIRGKIISVDKFATAPSALALGMLCASIGSASFVLFATRQGWPISTTHSIVGAVMGIGLVSFGIDGVDWGFSGMGGIVASWFISPVLAGLLAVIAWKFTENLVLKQPHSFEVALKYIPFYFAITVTFIAFFMFYKGMPGINMVEILGSDYAAVGLAVVVGSAAAAAARFFYVPYLKQRTMLVFAQQGENQLSALLPADHDSSSSPPSSHASVARDEEKSAPSSSFDDNTLKPVAAVVEVDTTVNDKDAQFASMSFFEKAQHAATRGLYVDVVNHPELSDMHSRVPKYDAQTELLYSSLQILTAAFASFAHGSNDIANAVGPLSTIFAVYSADWQQIVSANTAVPVWIILICTLGLDLGLLTYGYNIMRELGNKITYQSPARGFCMELAAGFAVLVASKLGWPVSTTHCITGATLAVGLASGDVGAVNWKRSMMYFLAWVICVPVSALIAGGLFALMAFAPKAYIPTDSGGQSIDGVTNF